MSYTKYVKENQEQVLPDFNWPGAIFGVIYLLAKQKFAMAATLFVIHIGMAVFITVFCTIMGKGGEGLMFSYLFFNFIADGFLTSLFLGAKLEEEGWKKIP